MATKPNGEIVPALKCSTCMISSGCSWACIRGDDLAEIYELRAAIKELADSAEHDLKCNQDYDGEHAPGGWWTLRTEFAIKQAKVLLNGEFTSTNGETK